MRERVFGQSGKGTTGLDDDYAAAYFEGIGAEIMGVGMFGLHAHPDDTTFHFVQTSPEQTLARGKKPQARSRCSRAAGGAISTSASAAAAPR